MQRVHGVEPTVVATAMTFAGVVVATVGVYAAVTIAPVVARDLTGSAFLAGLPVAALLAGAGAGASATSMVTRRHGRRTTIVASYTVSIAACLVALAGLAAPAFWLLIVGLLGVGVGHAANYLARYDAAEPHAPSRQAAVIGWIVWAQAIGAVAGPLLLGPAARLEGVFGTRAGTGTFAGTAILFAVAAVIHLARPRPAVPREAHGDAAAGRAGAPGVEHAAAKEPPARPFADPAVRVAAGVLVTGQVVMLLVMTMTPVHVHAGGHGLGAVGGIMSAHMLGMFGLAPVAGRLVARHGAAAVITAGLGVLGLGALGAGVAPAGAHLALGVALFLLGLGWSLGFVAASTLLTQHAAPQARAPLQARVEALVWTSGAAASVASGLLLGLVGFTLLCLASAALLLVPAVLVARHRPAGAV